MSNEFSRHDLLVLYNENINSIQTLNSPVFDRAKLPMKRVLIKDSTNTILKKIWLNIYHMNYRTILHYLFRIPVLGPIAHAILIIPRISYHFDKVRIHNLELQEMIIELEKELSYKYGELENLTNGKIRSLELEIKKLKRDATQ